MGIPGDGSGQADIPAEETRGGENPDWDAARPGEPLPGKQPEPDPESGGTW